MRNSIKRYLLTIWDKIYVEKQFYHIKRKYKLSVMTPKETIAYIKDYNCSIARYGDGEFEIMLREGEPGFQKGSGELSSALLKVFENTSKSLLICIPRFMVSMKGTTKNTKAFWKGWMIFHQEKIIQAIGQVNQNVIGKYLFGDTYVSRPFTAYRSKKNAKEIFPLLKDLWKDRDILIVEGTKTRLGIGNDLFEHAKTIKRILAPAENAFEHYAEILATVLAHWNGELLILALGPTATVLAADLSQQGIQALDLGHVDIQYEWYLKGDNSFQPVLGKYTNEAIGGQNVCPCEDADYLSQIVAIV